MGSSSFRATFTLSGKNMSVAGLFAGIGGFELAFADAGLETTLVADIDPEARAVLNTRFPDTQVCGDIAAINSLPSDVTIATAGFPCQNLSMAGDKSGIKGTKSRVIEKMFDLIKESQVQTVVVENVYFMLQLDSGNAMSWLTAQFSSLGYSWAYRVLNTIHFGLPHRRRRVYLVASKSVDPRGVLFADSNPAEPERPRSLETPLGFYWTEGRSGIGLTVDGIPPLKVGSGIGIPSAPAVIFPDGNVLTPSIAAAERLQGFPAGWTDIPATGSSKGRRWRLLGNAVSVPVAKWVAERIRCPGTVKEFETTRIESGRSWPSAGWNSPTGPMGVVANDRPIQCSRPSISDFLDGDWRRLSSRARDGFVKRASEGNLNLPDGFIDAVKRAHVR